MQNNYGFKIKINKRIEGSYLYMMELNKSSYYYHYFLQRPQILLISQKFMNNSKINSFLLINIYNILNIYKYL